MIARRRTTRRLRAVVALCVAISASLVTSFVASARESAIVQPSAAPSSPSAQPVASALPSTPQSSVPSATPATGAPSITPASASPSVAPASTAPLGAADELRRLGPAFSGPEPTPLGPATPQPAWTLRPNAVRPHDGGAAWEPERIAALRRDLDALLANSVLRGAHSGIFAVDTRNGTVLYDRGADETIQPASTFKLLVGSVALETLGPAFRFHTRADLLARSGESTPPQIVDGATRGLLVLRGGGDPFLSVADLDDFAAAVARAGVRIGLGSFAVNVTHFDRQPYAPGWTWDDFTEDYAAKISALTLEENVVHVFVESGGRAGAPAIVHVRPYVTLGIFLDSCGPTFEPIFDGAPTTYSAGAEENIDTVVAPLGCMRFTGGLPVDSNGASLDVAVPSPAAYAYRIAVDRLHANGVDVVRFHSLDGKPYEYTTVVSARPGVASLALWSHDSPPLSAMLPRFWIPSDNLVGENLLKELGVAAAGEPGTRAKGIALEKRWLQHVGIDASRLTIADGCGLSQYDRVTPRALVEILQHDWNSPYRELVLDALPVGGARGHIEGIDGTGASGRVWAKTGSMSHVRGLAGYVATKDRGTVTFAFEVDDYNGDVAALASLRAAFLARIARE